MKKNVVNAIATAILVLCVIGFLVQAYLVAGIAGIITLVVCEVIAVYLLRQVHVEYARELQILQTVKEEIFGQF